MGIGFIAMVWQIKKHFGMIMSELGRGAGALGVKQLTKFAVLVAFALPTVVSAQPLFEDDTGAVGGPFHIGETWGASWGDLNGDLYPDLFTSNHGALNSVLRNNGDGTFSEIVDQVDSERIWTGNPDSDIHGGSWADFDNDGDQDLFVTRSSSGARFQLMENTGLGGFIEGSAEFGIGPFGGGRMPIFFDYNKDGNLDVTLAGVFGSGVVLFRWDPVLGRYVVASPEAGIENQCLRNSTGFASDLFKNGKLHYICVSEQSVPERVYDTTTLPFTDVTGVIDSNGTNIDAVLADFNNDLMIDMMVNRGRIRPAGAGKISDQRIEAWFSVDGSGNDIEDTLKFTADGPITINVFARNVGDAEGVRVGASATVPNALPLTLDPTDSGTFGLAPVRDERAVFVGYDEVSEEWTITLTAAGQSEGAYIIVDGTNLSEPAITGQTAIDMPLQPRFLFNNGSRLVNAGARGIPSIQCGGLAAADFDNDMDIDIYTGCRSSIENFENRLYLNDGTGSFTLAQGHGAEGITGAGIQSRTGTTGTAIAADYNADGFMDLFVTNGNRLFPLLDKDGFSGGGPGQFFRNLANNGNNWVQIDLQGVASNRDGFGAKVTATAGGVAQFREQNGQYHRWAHDSRRIHFGLAGNTSVDISIEWPDGTVDNFTGVASNQMYLAVQGGAITPQTPTLNPPSVSISTDETAEGDDANLIVSIFPPSPTPVTVDYQTFDGSATGSLDFSPVTGTITFGPLQTERSVNVPGLFDVIEEANENYTVQLSNPSNALLNQPTGLVAILDNDDADANGPVISISDVSVFEGDQAAFVISISESPTQVARATFETSDGTALVDEDFEYRSGIISFTPGGPLSFIRRVNTVQDNTGEPVETFDLTLFDPENANVLDPTGTATVFDDAGSVPTLSIDSVSVDEGLATTVTVTLSAAITQPVSVDFASNDITATAGLDYVASNGSLTFLPGQVTQTIALTTVQDTLRDGNETLSITLSNPSNASLDVDTSLITIVDDEEAIPFLSISSAGTNEGGSALLTVSLSEAGTNTVTVDYATINGSALAGSDFVANSGTLTFVPGELTQTISIAGLQDVVDEGQEIFTVELSNVVEGIITQGVANVTIADDDDAPINGPVVSVSAATATEGNQVVFSLSLSQASSSPVRVNFATEAGTAGSAIDFIPRSGQATFQPGVTSITRSVSTIDDNLAESSETLSMVITNAQNANINVSAATGVILDDDTIVPSISIDNVSATEGSVANLTVSLSAATTSTVTVDFASSNGSALAGSDYAATSGTLTFAPGQLNRVIAVSTLQDSTSESDETFNVVLSNATAATATGVTGAVTILDDDAPISEISVDSVSAPEGGVATLTVSLSEVSSVPVSVDYATVNGSAVANSDFVSASGTVDFAVGELTQTIVVNGLQDLNDEANEGFTVQLSNPVDGLISQGVGNVTIIDDDGAPLNGPVISISGTSSPEGNLVVFTFTLSQASSTQVRADFETVAGTAIENIDFTPRSGRVTFQPGVTSLTRSVTTIEDGTIEPNETLSMVISNGQNGNIQNTVAQGVILDDDTVVPGISISDASVDEGSVATLTVSLSATTTLPVTVNFATTNDSATAGSDYTAASGSLTFAPGELSKVISLTTLQDAATESDETFDVVLSNLTNATVNNSTGTVTILDDDAPAGPVISISGDTSFEGELVVFTFTLSQASTTAVRADFATVNGTAQANVDFTPRSGRVTFQPGVTSLTRSVTTIEEALGEADETLSMVISNPVNGVIQNNSAEGVILDDDSVPADDSCNEPVFNRATDQGLFLWRDCPTNTWNVRLTAGGVGGTVATGTITSVGGFTDVSEFSFEGNDFLDTTTDPDQAAFQLGVGGAGQDGFTFAPVGSNACLTANTNAPIFLGGNKVPVVTPLNLDTLGACDLPTEPPQCGEPTFDRTNEPGVFLWQDCSAAGPDDIWFLTVSGGGLPFDAYEGTLDSSNPISVQGNQLEPNDVIDSDPTDNGIDFRLNIANSGLDGLDIQIPTGSQTCFEVQQLPSLANVFVGRNRVLMNSAFNLENLGVCQ